MLIGTGLNGKFSDLVRSVSAIASFWRLFSQKKKIDFQRCEIQRIIEFVLKPPAVLSTTPAIFANEIEFMRKFHKIFSNYK